MDGTKKMKLKPDSVPTIFSYTKSAKRRISSIQRQETSAKKICLEQAFEASQTKEVETASNMVDKAIECNFTQTRPPKTKTIKTRSIRTQYNRLDIVENIVKPVSSNNPVKIKIPIPKKTKRVSIGINTELTFHCDDNIRIVKAPKGKSEHFDISESGGNTDESNESPDEEPDEPDNIKNDPDFEPEKIEEQEDLPKDTKLIVFWTCLLPLLQVCMICRQLAFVKKNVFQRNPSHCRLSLSKRT